MSETYKVAIVKTREEREAAFALRIQVFVEEQGVPLEEEIDAYDTVATHYWVRQETAHVPLGMVGVARLVDKGGGVGKIGRVVVHADQRSCGVGAKMMRFIEEDAKQRGFCRIILEAQIIAEGFYLKLGYTPEGEIFMDCNIEHRLMWKAL